MAKKSPRADRRPERETPSYVIAGYHAVREAFLEGAFKIKEVWIGDFRESARETEIRTLAAEKGIAVKRKTRSEFEDSLKDYNHQGFAALADDFPYAGIEDIASKDAVGSGKRIVLAADHITDEGNLGAMIRTAAFFGAQGLIIPKDRSAAVTPLVFKRSSGGCASLPVARVVNLAMSLDYLKEKGFWVIGTAGEADTSIYDFDWDRDSVLVLGNEEKGLSQGIRKTCDALVSIPTRGSVSSLNVSVAAGIFLARLAAH